MSNQQNEKYNPYDCGSSKYFDGIFMCIFAHTPCALYKSQRCYMEKYFDEAASELIKMLKLKEVEQ